MAEPDLIDRRQRLAAAALLSAFDLPAEMTAAAAQLIQASNICPGVKVGEIPLGARIDGLRFAQELITNLVAEAVRSDG